MKAWLCVVAALCVPAVGAWAQDASLPAVSGLNGNLSLEAGGAGGGDRSSSAVGIAQGSVALPLGHSFGLQVDGLAGTSYSSFFGGGGAHLFWRDPAIGLAGPVAALIGGGGATRGLYGGEGELYAGLFTLGFVGGYLSATSPATGNANTVGNALSSGGVWQARLTVYPIPDLALSIAGGQAAGFNSGSATIEYQPAFIASHNVSLFVDGDIGDGNSWQVTSGVRFHFGADKTLIRRQREDDPLNIDGFLLLGNPPGTPSPLPKITPANLTPPNTPPPMHQQ
jgi:hypothetical protein